MIQFIHTADIHFGVENYGRIDPVTGIHSRLLDFDRAFNALIDKALEVPVDFLLFAGDAYKTAHPSPTQQKLFLRCLLRLYQAGIPVVIIIGNHDHPLSFGKAHSLALFNELPLDGFHVIAKPTLLTLQTKNGPVQIVGIPWPTRNTVTLSSSHLYTNAAQLTEYISSSVARIIADLASKCDPTMPAILSGHLTVSSGIFSGSEKRAIYGSDPLFLPSQLAIAPFDYVGLGHLHRYQNVNPKGYPAVVYSGSIERIDFGERKEEKGFCLVTIHEKNNSSHEFITIPTRPMIQIEVDLAGVSDQTGALIKEIKKHAIAQAIVKIIYHVPAERKDNVDIKAVQRVCDDAWCIVGIIPIRQVLARDRRLAVRVDMDFQTLLQLYFDSKIEFKDKRDHLIEQALLLLQETQDAESGEIQ